MSICRYPYLRSFGDIPLIYSRHLFEGWMPNSEFNLLYSIIALVAGAGVAFVCYYLSKANLAEDLAPKRLYTLGFVGLAIDLPLAY